MWESRKVMGQCLAHKDTLLQNALVHSFKGQSYDKHNKERCF